MQLPTAKHYSIIYADPPWSYYNDAAARPDCTTVRGMRRPPYAVLASQEIAAMPVSSIAADNSLLFIWTTDYHLARCVNVIEQWGFKYKTVAFAWQKLNKNGSPTCFMGAYTMKSGIELCLLGGRGKDCHGLVKNHSVRARIETQRSIHSRKPAEVRNRIVDLVGDVPRIELFATELTPGWDAWGDAVHEMKLSA